MANSVYLRAFETEDYLLINKWRNDPQIQKLTGGQIRFVSTEREKEWVREKMMNNQSEIYLSICMNEESENMIGYLSINNIDHLNRTADGGGIVIGETQFRDGTTLIDAWLLMLAYVFDNLNLNRFSGACLEEHKHSIIMMEAFNLIKEGCRRQVLYKNGRYHNQVIFSILRDEYYLSLKNGDYDYMTLAKKIKKLNINI